MSLASLKYCYNTRLDGLRCQLGGRGLVTMIMELPLHEYITLGVNAEGERREEGESVLHQM